LFQNLRFAHGVKLASSANIRNRNRRFGRASFAAAERDEKRLAEDKAEMKPRHQSSVETSVVCTDADGGRLQRPCLSDQINYSAAVPELSRFYGIIIRIQEPSKIAPLE
jgi:hypothetical protein